jgi:precorrin-6Y C5,15-methyltransferase (decarboxylating)
VVIGVLGHRIDDLPNARIQEIKDAPVVIAAARLLPQLRTYNPHVVAIAPRLYETLASVDLTAGAVIVASGDPGFFGITRVLTTLVDRDRLRIHPGPSSVSVAFARAALPWDDALVVSAHGRPLNGALAEARNHPKVAFLLSPENPPERLAAALCAEGRDEDTMIVAENLGDDDERISISNPAEVAKGRYSPLSVGIVLAKDAPAIASHATLRFGLPEQQFVHRDAMITKAELRAVILSKLELPSSGRFVDIGAGSGSVSVEVARVAPQLDVVAIDIDPLAIEHVEENAARFEVKLSAVLGNAHTLVPSYAPFDRAFVGGGGIELLRLAVQHCAPGGVVVASFAAIDRAAAAATILGSMIELSVARARRLPDGTHRLVGDNPTFVAWGVVSR